MTDLVPRAQVRGLFRTFRRTVFRLETQGVYREAVEAEPLRRFLAGEPPDDTWVQPWLDLVRHATAANRRFQRVRVLTEPLTDYLWFEMDLALRCNIPAGEDIRALSVSQARAVGLPEGIDFWMFDDDRVGLAHFGDHGMLGLEMIHEPAAVSQYRQWRDRAWNAAGTHHDWAPQIHRKRQVTCFGDQRR